MTIELGSRTTTTTTTTPLALYPDNNFNNNFDNFDNGLFGVVRSSQDTLSTLYRYIGESSVSAPRCLSERICTWSWAWNASDAAFHRANKISASGMLGLLCEGLIFDSRE